jgi:hypothetical protein
MQSPSQIEQSSAYPDEKEVVIAATSCFIVKSADYIPFFAVEGETSDPQNVMIPMVTLSSWLSWYGLNSF